MNLVDLIEKRRFVGREFLVWLWFESELADGQLFAPGFGRCEVRLEGQITLVCDKEQSRLKGVSPSGEPEAREALRQGKLPTQARVRVSAGELEYAFLFHADTLALGAIKIPNVMKDEAEEQFYERMYLVEELEAFFAALYGQFIAIRLSTLWPEHVLPAITSWIRGEEMESPEAHRELLAKVPPLGQGKRPATVPPPASGEAPNRTTRQVA